MEVYTSDSLVDVYSIWDTIMDTNTTNGTLLLPNDTFMMHKSHQSEAMTKPSLLSTSQLFVSPTMDPVDSALNETVNYLRFYYKPSIIGMGVIGGALSIMTLLSSMAANLPAAIYLAACSSVDFIYLLNLLLMWLAEVGVPVYRFGAVCHATTFIDKACNFLSMWYMVGYSVNMLIVTKHPNAERRLCTIAKAKMVCLLLAIIAIVVFLNISLLVHVHQLVLARGPVELCITIHEFKDISQRLQQIDLFINFILPVVGVSCISVSCAVQCYKDGRGKRLGPHRPPQRSIHVECDVEAGLQSLYFTFIITNIVLILPYNLMNAIFTISDFAPHPLKVTFKRHLVMELTKFIYDAKFAVNFIVFLLGWKGFRSMISVVCSRMGKRLTGKEEVVISVDKDCEDGMALCNKDSIKRHKGGLYYNV